MCHRPCVLVTSEARLGEAGSRIEDDALLPRQHAEKPPSCSPMLTEKLLGRTVRLTREAHERAAKV